MNPLLRIYLLVVTGVVLLFGGIWLGGHPESLPGFVRSAFVSNDRGLRAELRNDIKDSFYKPVSDKKLDQGSLKGMVDVLGDRFSKYLTPNETKALQQQIGGSFEGVGMAVMEDKRGLKVTAVYPGSPARKAGIEKGWFVTSVNGQSIAGQSSDQATAKIRGKAGTTVRIEVVDPDVGTPKTLTLKRADVSIPVASGRIVDYKGKKYGYVALTSFSSGAHAYVKQQVDKLRRQGAKGFVFDLRGNGGGLLNEGVLVSSIFIKDGLITYTKGRTSPRRDFKAQGGAIPSSIPMVVLVDGGSASASEITTGALRDTGRATVVGTKTFGKGVFQSLRELSNGGTLDITTGEYFLPKGSNIQGKGIKPQVRAQDDPKTKRDEALPTALKTLSEK